MWNYRHYYFREEQQLFRHTRFGSELVDLNSLSPFLFADPWSKCLKGKVVLVVHPFAKSISTQYSSHRDKLFSNKDVLPDFKELIVIPAVQSIGGRVSGYDTWFDALESMCMQIEKVEFDIALIGCGAYGLPLAAKVKSLGKKGVHIGGALQLLFGIKGSRWEGNGYDYHHCFYNDYWIRPLPEETPSDANTFENRCYW